LEQPAFCSGFVSVQLQERIVLNSEIVGKN